MEGIQKDRKTADQVEALAIVVSVHSYYHLRIHRRTRYQVEDSTDQSQIL